LIRQLRRWAARHSERRRYTPVGIAFHWLMAALVIYQLLAGWRLERLPVGGGRVDAYADHAGLGLLILLLAILRGIWRLMIPGPVNDADAPGWQADAAHVTHILFYALFALLPLSGWIMWSALPPVAPLKLAGILPVPPIPFDTVSMAWKLRLLEGAERAHALGIIGLALLVPMHIGAALKHHFWDRHDVLEGMLPEITDAEGHPQGPRHAPPPPPVGTPAIGG
jgi:cytochrome b561